MNELEALVLATKHLTEPFVLATVVRVRGSAYRRPGARMLVTESRFVTGSISGGCLEGDVTRRGFFRTRSVPAVVVTYDGTSDDDVQLGFGLGCDGVVEVLVERGDEAFAARTIATLADCVNAEKTAVIATIFRSEITDVPVGARVIVDDDGGIPHADHDTLADLEHAARGALRSGTTSVFESPTIDALVEHVRPPPHLFVLGSGHDAVPVVAIARTVGFRVTVYDRDDRHATHERFGAHARVIGGDEATLRREIDRTHRAAIVVMAHDYERDRAALAASLHTRARYIGVLGPRRRTTRMLAELEHGGLAIGALDGGRLHAPVGLRIGAETPQEIALSIVAEVQATLAAETAGKLRDVEGSIHQTMREVG